MHDSLTKHAAQLARLAMMIRIGLESAESAIPGINDLLAELATLGVTDFQVEGPAVLVQPELESPGQGVREHRAAPCRWSRGLRPRRFIA